MPPSTIGADLAGLLESGQDADVVFKVEDDTMPAHRIVLTTRSPMFQGMLNSGMREGSEGVVAVEGVRAPVFKALLHFVYTDSLPEVHFLTCLPASQPWTALDLALTAEPLQSSVVNSPDLT